MRTTGVRSSLVLASALGLGAVVSIGAQTPPQRPPVFRSGIDVVQLDVSVLDKNRRPIRNLTPADFEVFEDGKPQSIVAVSEISFPDETTPPPVWARAAPPDVASNDADGKRIFMMVIDVGSLLRQIGLGAPGIAPAPDLDAIEATRRAANGVLHRLGPDDLVAIVGRGISQPFTNDLDKLHEAVDSIRGIAPRPIEFPGQQRSERQREATGDIGGLHLLRNLTEYMMAMPDRRKAIIVITRGFAISARGLPNYLTEILHNAQQGNINIYAINPFELGPRASDSRRLDGLIALADNTGGTSINHPRDLDTGLEQIFLENGSYYLVGYRTSNVAMDGKFRRVTVKVRGRGDVIVRSRDQIYRPKSARPNGEGPAAVPSADMRPGMDGLLPNIDVAMQAVAMPFARAGTREVAVPLAVTLTEPVPVGTTRIVQRMNVRVLVYAERGDLIRDLKLPVPLDVAPGGETRIRYEVLSRLDLTPGVYSVRVVAQNHDTDKLGAIELDLTVPDFTRDTVSISGIALSEPSIVPILGAEAVGSILPVVPTSRRAYRSTDRVTAFARIYRGGAAPPVAVALEARVLNGAGAAVVDASETLAPERFASGRACDWTLDLPLDRLEAGHYLLTLQASLGSRHSPKRDVRFSIR